jgi:branched-chain amino acid transport system ATP-binding protein
MLAIGRAIMARPKLMLLDEPSLGLSPLFVEEVFRVILELNQRGIAILLVEQNTRLALDCSTRSYILNLGTVVRTGPSRDLTDSDDLITSVLASRQSPNGNTRTVDSANNSRRFSA